MIENSKSRQGCSDREPASGEAGRNGGRYRRRFDIPTLYGVLEIWIAHYYLDRFLSSIPFAVFGLLGQDLVRR